MNGHHYFLGLLCQFGGMVYGVSLYSKQACCLLQACMYHAEYAAAGCFAAGF